MAHALSRHATDEAAGILERVDLRSRVAGRAGEGAAPDGSFSKDERLRPRELVAGLAVGNETMAFQIAAPLRHPSSTNASARCPSS